MRVTRRSTISLLAILLSFAALAGRAEAQPREPIRYTFRVIDAAKHIAEVDARFPSSGQSSLDLMMPVWTPGFYRVEDYAARVQSLVARTPEGVTLDVTKPRPNRWQVATNGSAAVVVTYRLLCQGRSVTTTWVDASLGVINGGATFITVADRTPRPHEVLIDLPPTWQASISGLEPAPGGQPNHYRAADFDTLVDSPIVAGTLDTRQFVVDGSIHVIADAGDHPDWDGGQAAKDLEKMVRETRRFWGFLPFKRYVFLNVFRQGGGGLEHATSTLLTSSPKSTKPTRGWLSFVAHEYLHAFNVKRLRPVELGPFDYENPSSHDQPVAIGRRDDVCGQPGARAGRPDDARGLSRLDVVGDWRPPEIARAPGAVARAILGGSLDQQQLGRRRQQGHRQLLRQGQRRRLSARRAHPPADQRLEVVRRRDAAGLPAVRRRARVHRRRVARDVRRSRRPESETVVRQGRRRRRASSTTEKCSAGTGCGSPAARERLAITAGVSKSGRAPRPRSESTWRLSSPLPPGHGRRAAARG